MGGPCCRSGPGDRWRRVAGPSRPAAPPSPAGAQHAYDVAVRHGDGRLPGRHLGPDTVDDAVGPGGHLRWGLATRPGTGPYRPARVHLLDLGRGETLEVAVIPFGQVG